MNQLSVIGLLGLYFVCLLQGGTAVLGPAVAGLSETLNIDPNIVAQVGTFGAIFGIAASFLAGRFSGTKIKYKTFLVASLFIFVAGGSIPTFMFNWPVILFSRACVGFGVGVFYALPPALIMKYFEGDLQQKKLGMANAFGSAGGLIMQFAVGVLVDIQPRYVFGIFSIGLIALVLIVCGLKEPEDSVRAGAISDQPKVKAKIPSPVLLNCVLIFAAGVFWMPSLLFVSVVVTGKGLGSGVHAGTVAIMFNVAAIILSFAFSFLYKVFKKFLVIIVLVLVTIGMILEYNATSLVMAGAGLFLTGAFLLMIPTLLSDNGKYLAPESITFAASLLIIAMNLSGFVAGPFVQIAANFGKDLFIPGIYFGIFGEAAVVVIFFIIRLLQKDKPETRAA
jgi:MFS family permease